MTRVAIASVRGGVDAAFAEAVELAGCGPLLTPGARVVIKPNWNACGVPGSTSLAVVEAACRWARDQGAGEVVVGEGPVPVGRQRVAAFLEEMGALPRLEAVGARFESFDDGEHVLFRGERDLPEEIGIARAALEADLLINIPILKVHSCCLASLCVKNLKGCLRPQDKMAFHRVGLLPAIVGLNRIVRPHVNVIDAVDGMEGGHNRGEIVHLGLLIAGRDPVATDAVGCAQMGIPPADVPLLRLAAHAGLGEHRLDRLEILGEPLRPRRFELVHERMRRLYPDLEIHDEGACSACNAALMDGLYIAGGGRRVACVAMGKLARPPAGALVLGKCLRDYWPSHPHVPGCPPSGHAVARALCAEGDDDERR